MLKNKLKKALWIISVLLWIVTFILDLVLWFPYFMLYPVKYSRVMMLNIYFSLHSCFLSIVLCLICSDLMYIWQPLKSVFPLEVIKEFCLLYFYKFTRIYAVSNPGWNWDIKISFSSLPCKSLAQIQKVFLWFYTLSTLRSINSAQSNEGAGKNGCSSLSAQPLHR